MTEVSAKEWIKTDIEGLDVVLGGIRMGRTVALSGEPGCGKTVFCLQFAVSCSEQGMKTVYIASEEDADDLRFQAKSLGWDLAAFEEKGLLTFIELAGQRAEMIKISQQLKSAMSGTFANISGLIPKDTRALVVDSLGTFASKLEPYQFKDQIDLLIYELKKRNVTTLLVVDSATSADFKNVATYAAYGALRLLKHDNPFTGKRERAMDIVKMRGTKTPVELLPFEIGEKGIAMSWPGRRGKHA